MTERARLSLMEHLGEVPDPRPLCQTSCRF